MAAGDAAGAAGRPAPFVSLKRRHSSKLQDAASVKLSPLGFGSPMLGFDLMSFVEAVSTAVDEDAVTPRPPEASDALTFEVCDIPMVRTSASERVSFSSDGGGSFVKHKASVAVSAEPARRAPLGLGLLAGVLTGFAALTVCISLKAAQASRQR